MLITILLLILLTLIIGGDNMLALIMVLGIGAFYLALLVGAGLLIFAVVS